MSDRRTLSLTRSNLDKAIQGIRAAVIQGGWTLELRPHKRTDEQNDALHGLIDQIIKQRPLHFGVKADKETYKAIFMHGLGQEARFIPTLEGDGMFPLGQRTSKLTVGEFSQLIEFILAWCAREGIEVQHFDGQEPGSAQQASQAAA